jgi:hypothetical protein
MLRNRPPFPIAALMTLVLAACLFAHGRVWDFLGYTQVDSRLDHGKIEIRRHDYMFRAIQLRITGDAIFFDHVLVHFANGTYQNVVISRRVSSEQQEYVIDLPGEGHILENVEFFYFKEPWQQNPTLSLYGLRLPDPNVGIGPER